MQSITMLAGLNALEGNASRSAEALILSEYVKKSLNHKGIPISDLYARDIQFPTETTRQKEWLTHLSPLMDFYCWGIKMNVVSACELFVPIKENAADETNKSSSLKTNPKKRKGNDIATNVFTSSSASNTVSTEQRALIFNVIKCFFDGCIKILHSKATIGSDEKYGIASDMEMPCLRAEVRIFRLDDICCLYLNLYLSTHIYKYLCRSY